MEDAQTVWLGPEPPHLRLFELDHIRSLFTVRDPDGPDGVCSTITEIEFCKRYSGRCAFTEPEYE